MQFLHIYCINQIYKLQNTLPMYEYPTNQNLNQESSTPTIKNVEQGFLGVLALSYYGSNNDNIVKMNTSGIVNNFETIKFRIYKSDFSYRDEIYTQ